MLENIYTTKMSANKKQLQNRFSKIRSSSSRISKMMSLAMAVLVAVTMLCATVVLASVVNEAPEQFKIEVKHGNTVIQLDNKPYVYDNTVYLPLRELMEISGLLEHEASYINWDNGKIEMLLTEKTANAEHPDTEIKYISYNFGLEIGKAEYILNPSMKEMYQQKWNISNSKQMSHAPMLKDGVTYIPFEFVEYLINRCMTTTNITCSAWDLAYDDNTDRKADYINDSIGIDYANYYGEIQYDMAAVNGFVSKQNNIYQNKLNQIYATRIKSERDEYIYLGKHSEKYNPVIENDREYFNELKKASGKEEPNVTIDVSDDELKKINPNFYYSQKIKQAGESCQNTYSNMDLLIEKNSELLTEAMRRDFEQLNVPDDLFFDKEAIYLRGIVTAQLQKAAQMDNELNGNKKPTSNAVSY